MPRITATCPTCGNDFTFYPSQHKTYCSKRCLEQVRQVPERPCFICGKIFRPKQRFGSNGVPVLCCSDACGNLKQRKHQRVDVTQCTICGKALTTRQIANQAKFCSRACHGKNFSAWHTKPENKAFMREHGARVGTQRRDAGIHHRTDGDHFTHCQVCGKELTRKQRYGDAKACSNECRNERSKQWHAVPENKAFMRDHGTRTSMQGQRGPTDIECIMADALDAIGVVYVYQFPIGNRYGLIFSCDFAIPSAQLIIECDGSFWHSFPANIKRDKHKDAYLKAAGYTLLRFSDTQIKQDIQGCVQTILSYL